MPTKSHGLFSNAPAFCGLPLYALIDPYFNEPPLLGLDAREASSFDELQDLREQAWGREVFLALSDKPLVDAERLPYIVPLQGAHDPWYEQLLQLAAEEASAAVNAGGGGMSVGGFIECGLPGEKLMLRLEAMWTLRLPTTKRYLHVADPRVFEQLFHLLDEERMAQWLGPIHRWHVRTRDGRWLAVSGIADDVGLDIAANAQPSLFLSGTALARVKDGETAAQVLNRLQRLNALNDDSHERTWQAIEAARKRGLTHPDDVLAYAWRLLETNPTSQGDQR